ncbi:ankyrin repeat-containing domain protein [Trichoderma austrokoningii]
METANTQKSLKSDQSRDEIYLVGFLEAAGAPRAPSISELIQTLGPESRVQIQAIFNVIPDEPPIPDADLEDECDVDETEDETTSLSSQCGASVKGKRIILTGYGFGGIVVKQAIVIANTTPRYYPIAQSIARLVFFATPHMSVEHISWQDAMLEMMQDEGTCIYRDELFKRASDLASSMFQLSHVFYRFASKYPITNFFHGRHADIQQFKSDFETVVPWKQEASSKAMHGAIEDLGICEALRQHFCPLYIPSNSHHSPCMTSLASIDSLYLDALRMLGPSQWNLDEMKTLDSQRDYHELQKIYASSIHGITLETVRGGSILILEYFIDSLRSGHNVSPRWVKSTLTWAHLALRPLQIEELAVATAIRMDFDKISDIESATLKDWQRDLNTHLLSLVTVENRSVFTDNPLIEQILAKTLILKGEPPACDPLANEAAVEMSERAMRAAAAAATRRTDAMENLDPTQPAVAMASYVGLSPVVCSLLNVDATDNQLDRCKVLRGCLERVEIFSDLASSHYLDCIISNDDDVATKNLFNTNPEAATSQFLLHKAAWGGCSKVVHALLGLLDNSAQANDEGRTPLHMAVLCGHLDVVRILVRSDEPKGGSGDAGRIDMINNQDNDMKSPLIMATELGHVEIAQYLVRSGADLALKDGTGKAAVHYAVLRSTQILKTLITYNKSVMDMRDENDRTPLHFAAQYGVVGATTAIIEAAREIDHPNLLTADDKDRMTPLHLAAQSGHTEIADMIIAEDDKTAEHLDKYGRLPEVVAAKHGHLAVMRAITRGKLDWGNDLLVAASSSGQMLIIEYLLQNKVDPNGKNILSQRPMTAAAANGQSIVIRTLLDHHANALWVDSAELAPLHYAAKNGEVDVVLLLLTHGANHGGKEIVNEDGGPECYYPLHYAASKGHIEVMELLLAHGANIHARTLDGETPLHLAVGKTSSISLLLDSGAKIDARCNFDQTPLSAAVRKGCLESVRLLLDRGASITSPKSPSRGPLIDAISQDQISILAAKHNALNVLKSLAGEVPEAVTMEEGRRTLLWTAAGSSVSPDMLSFLLEAGSDVNHQGRGGRTPLMRATLIGNAAQVRELVKWKANVRCRDEDGNTALSLAATKRNPDVIKILIEAKAPINDFNKDGETPIYIASRIGEYLAQCLPEAGADPLHHAVVKNFEIAKALVDYGTDVNRQTPNGWSPLHFSASLGHLPVVHLLLDGGADPNLVNDEGMTALNIAMEYRKMEAFDAILFHGGGIPVDIDKPNGNGLTALHLAIKFRLRVVAKNLITIHRAKLDVTLEDGSTYLDFAIEEDVPEILVMLLDFSRFSSTGFYQNYQSLVVAYWRAIGKAQTKSIEGLLRANSTLAKGGSIKDGSLLAQFVKLGLDPFKRRQGRPLTCFELGLMSNDTELLDACANFIPSILKTDTSTLGFKELRMATEIEKPNIWIRLEPLMGRVNRDESDQDGWNIHHFLHQAIYRKEYAFHNVKFLQKTKTPTALVWPRLWQMSNDESTETRLEILAGGLEASFSARLKGEDPVTIRADFPFPPRGQGLTYFEVSILQTAQVTESEVQEKKPHAVIGLSGEFSNQAGAVPGCNMWTIGYDGGDGSIYKNGRKYTAGCGIDHQRGEYFFTLNGKVVFQERSDFISRKLYPSIGHCKGEAVTVKVNFGEDRFQYERMNQDREAYKR